MMWIIAVVSYGSMYALHKNNFILSGSNCGLPVQNAEL